MPLVEDVARLLELPEDRADAIVSELSGIYQRRMKKRFSGHKFAERIKRTNPFLLQIRNITTVSGWAKNQIVSTLQASEEEAIGHLIEAIAKHCYPGARQPTYPDDFDLEVEEGGEVRGYQIKMSWDCMPMSSRKNLSATIAKLEEKFASDGKKFVGIFAPAYGKSSATKPLGQRYESLASSVFWRRVGGNKPNFDVRVGQACALMCREFREELERDLLPTLEKDLTELALARFGEADGTINYPKLFGLINRDHPDGSCSLG
jgi:Type II restriction endonuclease EcoO109I